MLHIWGLSFWGFNPCTPPPLSDVCFLIIVQCAFATHFVRLSKLLSPFFYPCLHKKQAQAKTTTTTTKATVSGLLCFYYTFFAARVCVCAWACVCVCMCVWGAGHLVFSAKKQLSACSMLRSVSLCFPFSSFFWPSAFWFLCVCCCCCLRQLATVSCRLPLLVASNRINMLPMSVAAAYFKSKQAMFFLKPPTQSKQSQWPQAR